MRERRREYARAWGPGYRSRPEVRERRSEYAREYMARPEVRERLREYMRAYRREYRLRPDVREARRAYRRADRSRRRAVARDARVVGFSPEDLLGRLEVFGGRCWICRDRLGDGFHWDHVKPLSAGGPHLLANLRPACPPCNLSKGSAWPYDPAA